MLNINQFSKPNGKHWVVGSLLALSSSWALAAAFQLQEQSAAFLGTAFSGTTLGQDASMAFYNPAGLVHISKQQFALSNVALVGSNQMNTTLSHGWAGESVTGVNDNPGLLAVVPGLYYARRIDDKMVFGFGTTVPFGLKTEYSDDSYVRYLATKSEVQVIDLTPTIGYQWRERLALGGGLDVYVIQAKLDMSSDATGDGLPQADAWQKNRAHDVSWGYHVGLTYDWTENIKTGFAYHSPIAAKMSGKRQSTAFEETVVAVGVTTAVTLPEWVVLSAQYRLAPSLTGVMDVGWTRWSRIQELTLNYESATPGADGIAIALPLHFKNSRRVAVGLHYQYTDKWLLRAGTSFEETPIQEGHRSPRVPDTNRVWVGLGAGYQVLKNCRLDFGYGHIFFKSAHLDDTGPLSSVTDESIFPLLRYQGDFKSKADLIGLQLSWDYV